MSLLVLKEIWIYPVKSLGGIRMPSAKVLPKGLAYDRRYMLVDDENKFMTQREFPEMALFKLSLGKGVFRVYYKDDFLDLPLMPNENTGIETTKVWDDEVQIKQTNPGFNKWFSERLKRRCRLVFFPEENTRKVDEEFAKDGEQVSLADGYPFLIIGENSLSDLNSRLTQPVPMNRFRPNFVFEGGRPFEEDSWRHFTIGKNRFVGLKPCARCVMTTVDQTTGEKGSEPLTTLATFRKRDSKVYFGQNLVAIDHHMVKEGDIITIESIQ